MRGIAFLLLADVLAVGCLHGASPGSVSAPSQPPVYGDEYLVAGSGSDVHSDGGFLQASFTDIAGMALDPDLRRIYVVEEAGHSVRVVDLDAPGGPAVSTLEGSADALRRPVAVARAADGSFAVWDAGQDKIFGIGKDGVWRGQLFSLSPAAAAKVSGVPSAMVEGWLPGTWLLWDLRTRNMLLVSPTAQAGSTLLASGQTPESGGSPNYVKLGSSIFWVAQEGPRPLTVSGRSLVLEPQPSNSSEGIWWGSCAMDDMLLASEFTKGEFQHWQPQVKQLGHARPLDRGPGYQWEIWGKRPFASRLLMAYQPGLEQIYVAEAGSRKIFAVKRYRLGDNMAPPDRGGMYFPPQRQAGLRRIVVVGASQWYFYDSQGTWKYAVRANLARRMEEEINVRGALEGRPEHWELGLMSRGGTDMTGSPVSLAWACAKEVLAPNPDAVVVGFNLVDIQREALSFLTAMPDGNGFGARDPDPEWILTPVRQMELRGFAAQIRDMVLKNPKHWEPWIKIKSDGRLVMQTYDSLQFELIPDKEFRRLALGHFLDLLSRLNNRAKTEWKRPVFFAFLPSRNVMSAAELDDPTLAMEGPELSVDLLSRMRGLGLNVLDAWTPAWRADAVVFPLFLGGNRHFNTGGMQVVGTWLGDAFLEQERTLERNEPNPASPAETGARP